MFFVHDSKGNKISKGDTVIYLNESSGGYIKNNLYYVEDIDALLYERIKTLCVKTGQSNGWLSKYFLKYEKKSHYPEWF